MTTQRGPIVNVTNQGGEPRAHPDAPPGRNGSPGRGAHGGHGWMMIACCIPMIVIAIALVASGVVGVGFLVAAAACTAMMAFMMRGMGSDKSAKDDRTSHDRHGA